MSHAVLLYLPEMEFDLMVQLSDKLEAAMKTPEPAYSTAMRSVAEKPFFLCTVPTPRSCFGVSSTFCSNTE